MTSRRESSELHVVQLMLHYVAKFIFYKKYIYYKHLLRKISDIVAQLQQQHAIRPAISLPLISFNHLKLY